MDNKSVFLNGFIKEVYVKQPASFESSTFSYHVFKLNKDLYGLKQAPRAWYKWLSTFMIENNLKHGKVDTITLFRKEFYNYFIIFQIYVW